MKLGSSFYVWYASSEVVNFHTALEEAGLLVKQELIWNKNSMVLSRQDYHWKHEPCLYGWASGAVILGIQIESRLLFLILTGLQLIRNTLL